MAKYHNINTSLYTTDGGAAELWGLSVEYVKSLCAENKIISIKIGETWIVYEDQPNPKSTTM